MIATDTHSRIEAFRISPAYSAPIRPARPDRQWMDAFPARHAYRCLPLAMANTLGWEVLCPATVELEWNGGPRQEDLTIRVIEGLDNGLPIEHFVRSHFSQGIVTFHTGYIFRTAPGWSLLAGGPLNCPKQRVAPLTGIIESDWLPYTFTMNWQMQEPGVVRFERGDPFCTVIPIPKNHIHEWDIVLHDLTDDPVLYAEHEMFRRERDEFMRRWNAGDVEVQQQAWQRHYFSGRFPDGTKVSGHSNKVRLSEPEDRRGQAPLYARPTSKSDAANLLHRELANERRTESCPAQQRPLSFWRPSSLLEQLPKEPTTANLRGREKFKDGRLTGACEEPASSSSLRGIIYIPNFISAALCQKFTETANDLASLQLKNARDDPTWRNRLLFYTDILAHAPEVAGQIQDVQRAAMDQIRSFYELTAEIYVDTVQIVQWREGMWMPPHADRANPDGSKHSFAYRDFASVIYLNDDYDGGEIYFVAHDMVIKPRAGDLIAFTGGWSHEHAVMEVAGGTRLTMPAFYTFDGEKRDRSLYGA